MSCQICGGPQKELGWLGNRQHLRCINCGMDSSRIDNRDGTKLFYDELHKPE